jgi:hypothetical protein
MKFEKMSSEAKTGVEKAWYNDVKFNIITSIDPPDFASMLVVFIKSNNL